VSQEFLLQYQAKDLESFAECIEVLASIYIGFFLKRYYTFKTKKRYKKNN
jgi:putative flippase GtrA